VLVENGGAGKEANMHKIISILLVSALLAGLTAAASISEELDGKALFESKCGLCHGLDRPKAKKKSEDAWRRTVLRMKDSHGCDITAEEAEQIIIYLAKEYGIQASRPQLPADYRMWTAVAPSHRLDKEHIRMMLANKIMTEAYLKKTLPFPNGSAIVKLVYKAVKSPEWEDAVVPGEPVSIELWQKDSTAYKSTAGWGFARFDASGKYVDDAELYKTCFPCHEKNVSNHDYIFTRWAP